VCIYIHRERDTRARQDRRLDHRLASFQTTNCLHYKALDVNDVKGQPGAGAGGRRRGGPVLADGGAPGLLQRPAPHQRLRPPAVGGGSKASRRDRGHRFQAVLHACKVFLHASLLADISPNY